MERSPLPLDLPDAPQPGVAEIAVPLGARLRELRNERGLAVSATAAAAGIGKGSLSEFERGARNPTRGSLYALARALQVPLSSLLSERPGAEASSAALHSRLLEVDRDDGSTVEIYSIVVRAGMTHRSEEHGPGVLEHLLVIRGTIRAGREGDEVLLEAGRSHGWSSDVPHTYRAIGPDDARAVLTVEWPAPPPTPS